MFDFRIITIDGKEIIDNSLKTPFNSLTQSDFEKYTIIATKIQEGLKQGLLNRFLNKVFCGNI